MAEVVIRAYEPRDRAAIRRLCCETADRGEPVERFFHDREVFADLLLRAYTDETPHTVWVAESAGAVVGYLSGSLDTRRYQRVMASRIIPGALCKGIVRGIFWSAQTWRLLRAGAWNSWHGGAGARIPLDRYPAHFHLNLQQGFRGQRIGHALVARFLEQARAAGMPGVHASVRGDNPIACRFFERLGFTALGRSRILFPDGPVLRVHDTVVYGTSW